MDNRPLKLKRQEYRKNNKKQRNAYNREWYWKNIEKSKARAKKQRQKGLWRKGLLAQYGLTEKEYLEMFRKQNGKCAICGVSHLELDRKLAVDHNHETGENRGLLCTKCNLLLGQAGDNQGVLMAAVAYLKEFVSLPSITK